MKHYFKYSTKVKVMTAFVFILVGVISLSILWQKELSASDYIWVGVCWLPAFVGMSFAPIYYEDKEDEVVLRLLCFKLHYRLSDYELDHCVLSTDSITRLFGSGGFFGYVGWFNKFDTGTFLLYATNDLNQFIMLTNKRTKKMVLIEES